MKPPILRKIDAIEKITSKIILDGTGAKVLSDNGTYVAAGGVMSVERIVATQGNQEITIVPENNTTYLVDPNEFQGVTVHINDAISNGLSIFVKNISSARQITFSSVMDDNINEKLDPLNAVRLIFFNRKWYVL